MTLAELRGIKKRTAEEEEAEHPQAGFLQEGLHPGALDYVRIGVILAVVTLVEVVVYYIEALDDVLIPILVVLSAAKFSLVVLWFMHLRFDARFFSTLFVGGLLLAVAAFVVLLATLGGGLV